MNNIQTLRAKVKRIEVLSAEVLSELDRLSLTDEREPEKPRKPVYSPTEAECAEEYNDLYRSFLAGDYQNVNAFVQEKSKDYLSAFCRVNNLSLDTRKSSKDKVAEGILQALKQRKIITGGVHPH